MVLGNAVGWQWQHACCWLSSAPARLPTPARTCLCMQWCGRCCLFLLLSHAGPLPLCHVCRTLRCRVTHPCSSDCTEFAASAASLPSQASFVTELIYLVEGVQDMLRGWDQYMPASNAQHSLAGRVQLQARTASPSLPMSQLIGCMLASQGSVVLHLLGQRSCAAAQVGRATSGGKQVSL